jgi:hypothetical protein
MQLWGRAGGLKHRMRGCFHAPARAAAGRRAGGLKFDCSMSHGLLPWVLAGLVA